MQESNSPSHLKEKISDEIKAAMKAKDKTRLNVLRYLKKLFIENDTSGKPQPEMDVIIGHAKKTRESISLYPEGSAQREEIEKEVKVMEEFLPKPLTQEEVSAIIQNIISNLDAPNIGAIMKELSPQIKGKFDGKIASQMVKDAVAK